MSVYDGRRTRLFGAWGELIEEVLVVLGLGPVVEGEVGHEEHRDGEEGDGNGVDAEDLE